MIQTHDDYHFVGGDDFHEIIVNGGIMPLRSNPMILRGEDIVFLQEALAERQAAFGDVTIIEPPSEDAKIHFTRKISAQQLNMIIRGFRDLDDDDYLISGSKLAAAKFDTIPAGNRLHKIIDVSRTSRLDLPDEVSPGDKCRAAAIQQLLAAANDTKWVEVCIKYDYTHRPAKVTGSVIPNNISEELSGGDFLRRHFERWAMKKNYSDSGELLSVGDYKTLWDYEVVDASEWAIYLQVGNSWFLQNQYLEVWGLLVAERDRFVTYPPLFNDRPDPYAPSERILKTSCKIVRLTGGSSDYPGYSWAVSAVGLKGHFDELMADVGFSRSIPDVAATVSDSVHCYVSSFYFVMRLDRTSY